jgi:hypothetical protein
VPSEIDDSRGASMGVHDARTPGLASRTSGRCAWTDLREVVRAYGVRFIAGDFGSSMLLAPACIDLIACL